MTKETNDLPLYQQVKDMILDKIKNGELKPGDSLPTEPELMELFKVSRTTIRTAINDLKNEGYVIKQQGRGTFIANNSYKECVALLQGFYEDAIKSGSTVKTIALGSNLIIPDDELAVELESNDNDPVLKIDRLRYVDGEIVNMTTAYLSKRVHEKLDWKNIDFGNTTLYGELKKAGFDLDSGEETIEVMLPNDRIASYLRIDNCLPIVKNQRKVYNKLGQLIEYSVTYTRGDKYRNYVKLKKNINY